MTYPIADGQAYYTAARADGRSVLLTGPHDTHQQAADALEVARYAAAREFPAQLAFAEYGVALGKRNPNLLVMFPATT